jgi:hypothetical protein
LKRKSHTLYIHPSLTGYATRFKLKALSGASHAYYKFTYHLPDKLHVLQLKALLTASHAYYTFTYHLPDILHVLQLNALLTASHAYYTFTYHLLDISPILHIKVLKFKRKYCIITFPLPDMTRHNYCTFKVKICKPYVLYAYILLTASHTYCILSR